MLKRVAIDLGIVLGVALLGIGYLWLRDYQARHQMRKDAEAFIDGSAAQATEIKALGEVNIEPTDVNFTKLKSQLHEPSLIKDGRQNTKLVGWACAAENCAILASFQVPLGQEISQSEMPISIMMLAPVSARQPRLGIDNVYLGEKTDEVDAHFPGQRIDRSHGRNRVSLAKDWELTWAGDRQVSVLLLSRSVSGLLSNLGLQPPPSKRK